MALRVLLADESATIKKVFQLALQDYAVEVKTVNVGLDVVPVAKSYKPDVIFADVLLQKRSGYEVSADLKKDGELSTIPVVLMWSGFMDLDQDKYQASLANASLEKPFDVGTLRKLIQELVPKTKTQKLSGFLNLPKMPEFSDQEKNIGAVPPAPTAATPPPVKNKDWGMDSFEPPTGLLTVVDDDDFKQVPIAPAKGEAAKNDQELLKDEPEDKNWQRADLSRFKLQMDEATESDVPVEYVVPDSARHKNRPKPAPPPLPKQEAQSTDDDDLVLDIPTQAAAVGGSKPVNKNTPLTATATAPGVKPTNSATQLSEEKLEQIIREQSLAAIEAVVWKIVPDLAARIIERELNRLLNEKEGP